ncbi:MAG: glycosyltransferase family 4 protein [Chloroflexota bacterium]|nr:glycosyltransferase family 4 protein [Chloroflexota bacterium]
MAHILFITPYYPPEITPPATRISETALCLVKQGHRVTILTTFPNFPSGIVAPEYRGRVLQREEHDGICVVRVWSYATPNRGFLRRILAQLSFGCLSAFLGWQAVGRPDVIIVESPPLFDAIAGRILARLKHCSFIFTVADIWPESAIQLGMLRNRLLIRLAEWLEWSTYRRAGAVWAVTKGIRQTLIQRGLAQERVFVLTNGVDTTRFRPLPKAQARAELGWDERFTVLYAGNHGMANALSTVIDAADMLRDDANMHIVLVGDGVQKADLMEQARRRDLTNVTFLDAMAHERMPWLIAGADVCLIPLRKLPVFEGALPSKIFEVLACARPCIVAAEGIARQFAEQEAGAAISVEPENASALASAILYLREHPDIAETLGQRGCAFVKTRFDRTQLALELESHISRLLDARRLPKRVASSA